MKSIGSLTAVALFVIAGVAWAQTVDPGINAREENQMGRIQQGVQSGALTRHEARRLRTEERRIRAAEHAFESGGNFDRAERSIVRQDLNRARRAIYRQKHDAQRRPPQPATTPTV